MARQGKRGRKAILEAHPERAKRFLEALEAGNYACVCCEYAGFSQDSLYDWLKRGEQELADGKSTPYTEFLEAYKNASVKAEMESVECLKRAGPEDWKAAATYLERRHPERWARQERVRQDVTHSGSLEINPEDVSSWSEEKVARVLEALATPNEPTSDD